MAGSKQSRREKRLQQAQQRDGELLQNIRKTIQERQLQVESEWVRGHGVNPYQLRADFLAGKSAAPS